MTAEMRPAVVSWSGGKDSTMALLRARERGLDVVGLVTMFDPDHDASRSHGLPRGIVEAQAAAMGLPLHAGRAGWEEYEAEMLRLLSGRIAAGVEVAVFGDIFLDGHREWVEKVCGDAGCEALEPLWGEPTDALAREALARGVEARICSVRSDVLDDGWLGAPLDEDFLAHAAGHGLDPCGEHGEYHTVVLAGPHMDGRLVVDEARVGTAADHHRWDIRRWHRVAGGP